MKSAEKDRYLEELIAAMRRDWFQMGAEAMREKAAIRVDEFNLALGAIVRRLPIPDIPEDKV